MASHVMLVPSSACPASCSYCFGPHAGGAPMSRRTVEAVVAWQRVRGRHHNAGGGRPLSGVSGAGRETSRRIVSMTIAMWVFFRMKASAPLTLISETPAERRSRPPPPGGSPTLAGPPACPTRE